MRNDFKQIYVSLTLSFLVVILGTLGYIFIEGYTLTEAVYMTIITAATVGFKEVHDLSEAGMWFTSLLIVFSFGIFAYSVTTITKYTLEGTFKNLYKDSKLKSKMRGLKDHVIICGYGRNGIQASIELLEHNVPVVIIDSAEKEIEKVQENPKLLYYLGDATQSEVLEKVSIDKARALITTLPQDADNLYVVLTAKEMNESLTIISRASNEHSDSKLKRAGASNVIMPDRVGGQRMAKLVAQPDVVEFLDYIMLQSVEQVVLEEVGCQEISDSLLGKSMREIIAHNSSGANIIGIKRPDNSYIINPDDDLRITPEDKIFALGSSEQLLGLRQFIQKGK